ncbi:MAG TPA: hypothetical protein VF651_04550 [Gammaproteobacteria bacterium]|jgi:hypothetical protein|nr:hypothetical protein [Gammaproteobacteria bacterium]
MCFAGIEEDVKNLVERVAAKAEVHALDARIDHGHLHLLVENRGWVRSTDLLAPHVEEDDDALSESITVRHLEQPALYAPGR